MRTEREIKDRLAVILDSIIDDNNDIAYLIKKGAKFSNIITFMNSWCLIKVSTLLFEFSALGYKFTLVRLLIDIPGVLIMSYLVNLLMSKDSLNELYNKYN